jgi:glycosyltransferase involved in cell wall biosynthesis
VERGRPARDHVDEKGGGGLTMLVGCRNQRASLPRALRSAFDAMEFLDAAGLPAEVVVVDNASVDGSQKMLRSVQVLYDEPRLKVLCLKENVNPSRLRDLGLRASTFNQVCVMNADNELVSANLPLFMRGASDTGAAIVYGNVIVKRDGEIVGVRSNMPVVPGLAKSRRLDALSILDASRFSNLDAVAEADANGSDSWVIALRLLAGGEQVVFVPAVLGYFHERTVPPGGMQQFPGVVHTPPQGTRSSNVRERDGERIGRIYYPEVGFID